MYVNRLPSRRFTCNVKTYFHEKKKKKKNTKKYIQCRLLQILPGALRLKLIYQDFYLTSVQNNQIASSFPSISGKINTTASCFREQKYLKVRKDEYLS